MPVSPRDVANITLNGTYGNDPPHRGSGGLFCGHRWSPMCRATTKGTANGREDRAVPFGKCWYEALAAPSRTLA